MEKRERMRGKNESEGMREHGEVQEFCGCRIFAKIRRRERK
jgi:hypothetical protein